MVSPVRPEASVEELRARTARAQLYVLTIQRTPLFGGSGPEEAAERLQEHLLYLWELEATGKLFGAGPLARVESEGEPVGMIIVAAASVAEAAAIAANEPYQKAGWRTNTVRSWTLNEGATAVIGKMMASLASAGQGATPT